MKVGMLTSPFWKEPLDALLDFADTSEIRCLEVHAAPGSLHIDPAKATAKQLDAIKGKVGELNLEITALAYYDNVADAKRGKDVQAHVKRTIDAASRLGVSTVCLCGGWPVEGMTKIQTIQKVLPKIFKPLLEHARRKNVNIALENYFATCLQGIDTFEAMFEAIPDANFGLNYDPSHLVHQECDYFLPVSMFKDRLFHTHAKDTYIDRAMRAKVGVYGQGWWRYVIPGFGLVDWPQYITHLRIHGYDGVLSIEHEDSTQTREEGFMRGAWYLEQFC